MKSEVDITMRPLNHKAESPSTSVLICTYKRPDRIPLLLQDLQAQSLLPDEVIVVDNDAAQSARAAVMNFAAQAPFPVRYEVQPQKNISLTRNRTVALAQGDWLAFLDDDERVKADWLRLLLDAANVHQADGVLAPVISQPPPDAPGWILKGDFYSRARARTGTVVPSNQMRMGNVLLRGALVRAEPGPFDQALGLTGGEDADMLTRLTARGARLIWCDEAVATEPVERSRLSLKWLLLRALRGGQDYAVQWRKGRYGSTAWHFRVWFAARAAIQFLIAVALVLLVAAVGRHHSVRWLQKACSNAGKLTALMGWHYREYDL